MRARLPLIVAGLVWLVYGGWTAVHLARGHKVIDFVVIGRAFALREGRPPLPPERQSPVIGLQPGVEYSRWGYDGQFAYFMAIDPLRAREYVAQPAYRYGRVLYPLLARVLALGRIDWVPYAMLGINFFALGAGTFVLALWLRRRGASPWLALAFGFFPGFYYSYLRDLTEPLAFGLAALGVTLYQRPEPRRVAAAVAFALAALTREVTLVFPIVYALVDWAAGRRRGTAAFLALAAAPIVAWKAFLAIWLGGAGIPKLIQPIPFAGLVSRWPFGEDALEEIRSVIIPTLICLAAALWALRRVRDHAAPWLLAVHCLAFVVFLGAAQYVEYIALGRASAGVMLAALATVPVVERRAWIWPAAALWWAPTAIWLVEPIISYAAGR